MAKHTSSGAGEHEGWFRVRVDLSQFYPPGDVRARALVRAPGARRVRWLARRVRALFPALPPARRLALLSAGHLLPPAEPLALLRPDDVVQVVPFDDYDETCDESDATVADELMDSQTESRPDGDLFGDGDDVLRRVDVDASPATDDETDLPGPAPTETLAESKRRALRMLERLSEPEIDAAPGLDAHIESGDNLDSHEAPSCDTSYARTRPRRRRVRRRRRVPLGVGPAADVCEPQLGAGSGPDATPGDSAPASPAAPAVRRNGCGAPRAPRLVLPLSLQT